EVDTGFIRQQCSQCLLPPLSRIDPVDGQVDPLPLERLLPPDTGTQRAHDHDSAGVTLTSDLHSGEGLPCAEPCGAERGTARGSGDGLDRLVLVSRWRESLHPVSSRPRRACALSRMASYHPRRRTPRCCRALPEGILASEGRCCTR